MTDLRNQALAKIHLGKTQLGLDDDTYRQMLKNIGGVDSAKDLDNAGLSNVIKHLRKSGAKFQSAKHGKKPHNLNSLTAETAKLLGKVEALLTDMKLSWNYADGIAKQMYKKDALAFCSSHELIGIITALTKRKALQK